MFSSWASHQTNELPEEISQPALGSGWIPWPILAPKLWPRTRKGKRPWNYPAKSMSGLFAAEQNVEHPPCIISFSGRLMLPRRTPPN